jgi:hypothetical protein
MKKYLLILVLFLNVTNISAIDSQVNLIEKNDYPLKSVFIRLLLGLGYGYIPESLDFSDVSHSMFSYELQLGMPISNKLIIYLSTEVAMMPVYHGGLGPVLFDSPQNQINFFVSNRSEGFPENNDYIMGRAFIIGFDYYIDIKNTYISFNIGYPLGNENAENFAFGVSTSINHEWWVHRNISFATALKLNYDYYQPNFFDFSAYPIHVFRICLSFTSTFAIRKKAEKKIMAVL